MKRIKVRAVLPANTIRENGLAVASYKIPHLHFDMVIELHKYQGEYVAILIADDKIVACKKI
jgi:hypothetical protein